MPARIWFFSPEEQRDSFIQGLCMPLCAPCVQVATGAARNSSLLQDGTVRDWTPSLRLQESHSCLQCWPLCFRKTDKGRGFVYIPIFLKCMHMRVYVRAWVCMCKVSELADPKPFNKPGITLFIFISSFALGFGGYRKYLSSICFSTSFCHQQRFFSHPALPHG